MNATTAEFTSLFEPREVELEQDTGTGQLGSGIPLRQLTEEHQSAQTQKFFRWRAGIRAIALHQGRYRSRPATLLVLEYTFRGGIQVGSPSRFSDVRIKVKFESEATSIGEPRPNFPSIRLFSPKKLEGLITPIQWNHSFSPSVGIRPIPMLPVEASLSWSRSREGQCRTRIKMIGDALRTDGASSVNNKVRWRVVENKSETDGVPEGIRTAILVDNDGVPMRCSIQISARTALGVSLFGWPWSEQDPVLISTSLSYGEDIRTTNFDAFTDDDWKTLCSFDGEISDASKWSGS